MPCAIVALTMRKLVHVPPVVVLLSSLGCAPHAGRDGASQGATTAPCAVRLTPRGEDIPSVATTGAPFEAPQSTLIVNAEVPLAALRQELETHVPRRVVEKQEQDIGVAGRLEYTVDRGAFSLRVEGDVLVVEAPLHGRAEACAKGRCYAGCNPEARVTARVPLRLGTDYRLRTSDVRIDVTRGCKVRALGGFVSIDVTPMVQGAIAGQARGVQASIDRQLPNVRPVAARLWDELMKPRPLPLGACAMLQPEGLVQGTASGTSEFLRIPFGVVSRPELHVRCAPDPAPKRPMALPPLREMRALPKSGDVHLAIVLPPDAPARALDPNATLDLGGAHARIARASGDPASGLAIELAGEACGDVAMNVGGAAWGEANSVHLTRVSPTTGEGRRLDAAHLDGARLAAGIERTSIPLPIAVDALATMLPELARGLEADQVAITVSVDRAAPESAGLRGASVVATALLRGTVTVRPKM